MEAAGPATGGHPLMSRRALSRGLEACAAAALLAALAVSIAGCRSAGKRDGVRLGWSQRGHASWYGMPFHGRRTASGEIYDMHRITAAHRELPFGTILEVRNLDNERRVQVRVTDRGPFVKGRILDLSYAAALQLDMVRTGTAEVELRVVDLGELPLPAGSVLTLQVGAFQSRDSAEELAARLGTHFPEVRIEEALPWFRVRVGTFADLGAAEEMRRQLRRRGYAAMVLRAGLGARLSDGP
jgi:rare lipoprotein A